jgi:hypothetical protein
VSGRDDEAPGQFVGGGESPGLDAYEMKTSAGSLNRALKF